MTHGGHRQGAGRKQGAANLLTSELREKINAERLINFLQRVAEGKVKGATISERKDAAVALLKKVLPDCRPTEPPNEPEKTHVILTLQDKEGNILQQL